MSEIFKDESDYFAELFDQADDRDSIVITELFLPNTRMTIITEPEKGKI